MCTKELAEFVAELTAFALKLSEFSLPKLRDGEKTMKIKFLFLRGWGLSGQTGTSSKNADFHGKHHDNNNKILNVEI